MTKYLIHFLLFFSWPLAAATIKACEVYESNTDDSIYHIAIYPDNRLYIITDLEGLAKGIQNIYYEGNIIATSANVSYHHTYFLHSYPGVIVYSTNNKQKIHYTKHSALYQCTKTSSTD